MFTGTDSTRKEKTKIWKNGRKHLTAESKTDNNNMKSGNQKVMLLMDRL